MEKESSAKERKFPSPFEVPTPEGCEGWERLYPYFYLFSEDLIPFLIQ